MWILRLATLIGLIAAISGQALLSPPSYIVAGFEVSQPFNYTKWLVGFQSNGQFICGGFMVGPNTVVTAARKEAAVLWSFR